MRLSRFETEILRFNADRAAYERADQTIHNFGFHFGSEPEHPWIQSHRAAWDEEVGAISAAIRGGSRGAIRVALRRWSKSRLMIEAIEQAAERARSLGHCSRSGVYLKEDLRAGIRTEEYMGRGQWRDYPGAM